MPQSYKSTPKLEMNAFYWKFWSSILKLCWFSSSKKVVIYDILYKAYQGSQFYVQISINLDKVTINSIQTIIPSLLECFETLLSYNQSWRFFGGKMVIFLHNHTQNPKMLRKILFLIIIMNWSKFELFWPRITSTSKFRVKWYKLPVFLRDLE